MKNGEWVIKSIEDLTIIVDELLVLKPECAVYTFEGPLGAGKTTLCQQFLQACGIEEPVVSPTFAYLNVYKNQEGEMYYHFDLYRLQSMTEFLDAGFDEYLYQQGSWCLIEWPEIIKPLLTHNLCAVTMDYHPDGRLIKFDITI